MTGGEQQTAKMRITVRVAGHPVRHKRSNY